MKMKEGRKMKKNLIESIELIHKNIIISGSLGTEKTRKIAIPLVQNYINKEENFFVLDSKEEYIGTFEEELKSKGYNTIIINIKDNLKSEGWNPLYYPAYLFKNNLEDKALENIKVITDNIFYDEKSPDPFWNNTANDFCTGLLLSLFEDAKVNEINLQSLEDILNISNSAENKEDYLKLYLNTKNKDSFAYKYTSATISSAYETKASIIATAKQKLCPITGYNSINKVINNHTIDMTMFKKKKTAVFFVGFDKLSNTNKLASIFINQLINIIAEDKIKFNFLIDNFDTILNFSNLENILSSSISNNSKIFIITRDIDLLFENHSTYIKKLATIINVNNNDINIIESNNKEVFVKPTNNIVIKHKYEFKKEIPNKSQKFDLIKYVESKIDIKDKTDLSALIKDIDAKLKKIKDLEKNLK